MNTPETLKIAHHTQYAELSDNCRDWISSRYGVLINNEREYQLDDILYRIFEAGKADGRAEKVREFRKIIGA